MRCGEEAWLEHGVTRLEEVRMALVSMVSMLEEARRGEYAVGYFEAWNLESLKAVVDAAEEAHSPVIIGFNAGIFTSAKRVLPPENLEYFGAIGRIAAEHADIPAALILNEISSFGSAMAGMVFGFNVLMLEPETDDLEENILLTQKVVEAAHAVGVAVEAKVGSLPMAEKGVFASAKIDRFLTDPDEAEHFVDETGVDALGVSVGNVEVLMKGKAEMRLDLLERISRSVSVPLVLHGGSGIADDVVGRLIERGVRKMNLGAMLNQAFLDGMREAMANQDEYVSPKYALGSGWSEDILAAGQLAMKEVVKKKMVVYGSAGKADGS
jgi:fructose-bisphosphate aldolase class II